MLDAALAQLVTAAVSEAQQPLVRALEEARSELAALRRELAVLQAERTRELPQYAYLSVAQVAERLGTSQRTVKRWLNTGKLPFVRLPSGGIRVSTEALNAALESKHREAAE